MNDTPKPQTIGSATLGSLKKALGAAKRLGAIELTPKRAPGPDPLMEWFFLRYPGTVLLWVVGLFAVPAFEFFAPLFAQDLALPIMKLLGIAHPRNPYGMRLMDVLVLYGAFFVVVTILGVLGWFISWMLLAVLWILIWLVIGQSIVALIGGGILIAANFIWRARNRRWAKETMEAERIKALRVPEFSGGTPGRYHETWKFDFVDMLAHHEWEHLDPEFHSNEMLFHLRRLDGPRWQTKATEGSARKESEWYEKHLRENPPRPELVELAGETPEVIEQERKERRDLALVWRDLPDKIAPKVETAYQLFLRDYRP